MDRAHWGGSYNFAKKQLLIDYAFHYVDKIIFEIAEDNIRSQIGNTRFGLEETGRFVKVINGKQLPYITYRLTPELWAHTKLIRA